MMARRLAPWRMIQLLIALGIFCTNPISIHAACDASTFAQAMANLKTNGYTPVTQPDPAATIGYFRQWISPIGRYRDGDDLCKEALGDAGADVLVDYHRTAVFETPTLYKTAMDDLVASGVTSKVVIGITNSDSTEVMNCFWTSMDGAQYCAIFVDAGGFVSVPSAYSVAPIGNSGSRTPYVFTVIPSDPYRFIPMYDDKLGLPVICEFGCGTAPSYSKSPEWAKTPPSVGSTTGSLVRSTTTASPKTSTTTPAASSSQNPVTPNSASVLPSSCTPATIADFCNTLKSQCYPTLVYNDVCYAIDSVPNVAGGSNFDAAVDECKSLISTNDASSFTDYGRIAVFKDPATYFAVMNALENTPNVNSNATVFGASTGIPMTDNGLSLNQYFWTPGYEANAMCYIFSTDGTKPASVSSTFTVTKTGSSPCGSAATTLRKYVPCVLSVNAASPKQFMATGTGQVHGAVLFQYGCGSGKYTSTPDWLNDPAASSNSLSFSTCTSTTESATTSSSVTSVADCAKLYALTASCIIGSPTDLHPNIAKPQDCANLCTSTVECRSFNFKLGDASCGQNTCELFDRISSEIASDQSATTSASTGACYHYDSVE